MKIFVLEDGVDQLELYTFWLSEYDVRAFDHAREFIKKIPYEKPDILLVDWNLPKIDGMDVLHWLKGSQFSDTPIIFLTSRSTEEDMVKALTDGADDYIVKPASEAILKARIKAVTRRLKTSEEKKQIDSDPYVFNQVANTITYDGKNVSLTNKEFDLALYFFANAGLLVSREQLLESIWVKSSNISTRTVDTHISRLRKKLNLNGTHGWKLTSIYHQGYKLVNQN